MTSANPPESSAPAKHPRPFPYRKVAARTLAAAGTGAAVLLFFSLIGAAIYQSSYAGRIYPGVSVSGLDLSGLTAADAARQLVGGYTYLRDGKIVFQFEEKTWTASPADLGLNVNYLVSVDDAYAVGRSGGILESFAGQYRARFFGVSVAPVLQYDGGRAMAYLQNIAAAVDRPPQEAKITLSGLDVAAQPGAAGRQLDMASMLSLVAVPIGHLANAVIPVIVHEQNPQVLDASAQAETARSLLSQNFSIVVPDAGAGDPGPWALSPQVVADMLSFRETTDASGTRLLLALDEGKLQTYLQPLTGSVARTVANPRYHFNDSTGQIELFIPAVRGRVLNLAGSIESIQQAVGRGDHQAPLAFDYTEPAVGNDATAQTLGIAGLLPNGMQWTSFSGSAPARIHNITLAASQFDGVLVAPGEVFSMGAQLGDVSLDTGYAEALIILGDKTINGAGGGVCQVSTTLFRTALMTGFPIVERHAHAYRVGYYENGDGPVHLGAGFDATVFFPEVDFKFRNDSASWILMETSVDPSIGRLTWSFYSTSDGRSVSYGSSGITNVVDPPDPVWEANASLQPNDWKQVDWAVKGAEVIVWRTVSRDGQVIDSLNLDTRYIAWPARCQYSPDTPPADGTPCPP